MCHLVTNKVFIVDCGKVCVCVCVLPFDGDFNQNKILKNNKMGSI